MQHYFGKVGTNQLTSNRTGVCPEGFVPTKGNQKPPFDEWELSSDGSFIEIKKSNGELFAEEMTSLNDKHYQDVLDATNSYNIAKARDGSTETEKVIAARAKLADIDTQYEVDQLAIINKYYGA
ncbi:hypothetical protein pA_gene0064 [Vibrio phage 13VT501A]|nr:hypothetical protein pA_gene0064 [Vibrio phage 13VT501A]